MTNIQFILPTDATHMSSSINSLDILDRLGVAVKDNHTGIATAIKNAIRNHTPAKIIISNIKEMAQDNRQMIEAVIGESLTAKILAS